MLSASAMIFDARIQKEAQALRDEGYKVTIIYTEDKNILGNIPDLATAQAKYEEAMVGITSLPIYLQTRKLTAIPHSFRRILQALELMVKVSFAVINNKADYYHCHDLTPAMFALFGKFWHNGQVLYDAHEFEVPNTTGFLNTLWLAYERNMVKKCAAAITVNESIAQEMESRYGKKVNVIMNREKFVENSLLRKTRLREKLNLPAQSKIIMYVGYLNFDRGIDKTVAALAHLPDDVYFCIMGVGNVKAFREQIDQITTSLHIKPERIMFIGPYPPEDIVYYLSDADVSVLLYQTALDENNTVNTPNKLSQSVMARVPVLASHNKTFPEIIYNNPVGSIGETVDEKKPEEIAAKVAHMLDPTRNEAYRKHEELLAYTISWLQEKDKLVQIYKSL